MANSLTNAIIASLMKPILISLLAGFSIAISNGQCATAEEIADSHSSVLSGIEVMARMDAIIIQYQDYQNIPFSELLTALEKEQSKEQPIRFIQLNTKKYDPIVKLQIAQIGLADLLTLACQQVNYTWRVQSGVVVCQRSTNANNQASDSGLEIHVYRLARTHCYGGCFGGRAPFTDPFAGPSEAKHLHIPSFTEPANAEQAAEE